MLQYLDASVNSAPTSCPLGNRACAPLFSQGSAKPRRSTSGASARAVTTSTDSSSFAPVCAIRAWCTIAGAPVTRTASRRNAAFLPLLSMRWTWAPGVSARAQAIARPGNPPPEPRSSHVRTTGARGMSCSESAMCRVQISPMVVGAIRLIRFCHVRSSATKRSSLASVSRETGLRARAASRSAASAAATSVRAAGCRRVGRRLTDVMRPQPPLAVGRAGGLCGGRARPTM